mmetsp:Transcript_22239/g.62388  ORF Transcript_22239/g.62388 Transcript_22239/m.62388 type:complete len:300 (+) Transcript_22239:1367-2266(+)
MCRAPGPERDPTRRGERAGAVRPAGAGVLPRHRRTGLRGRRGGDEGWASHRVVHGGSGWPLRFVQAGVARGARERLAGLPESRGRQRPAPADIRHNVQAEGRATQGGRAGLQWRRSGREPPAAAGRLLPERHAAVPHRRPLVLDPRDRRGRRLRDLHAQVRRPGLPGRTDGREAAAHVVFRRPHDPHGRAEPRRLPRRRAGALAQAPLHPHRGGRALPVRRHQAHGVLGRPGDPDVQHVRADAHQRVADGRAAREPGWRRDAPVLLARPDLPGPDPAGALWLARRDLHLRTERHGRVPG